MVPLLIIIINIIIIIIIIINPPKPGKLKAEMESGGNKKYI